MLDQAGYRVLSGGVVVAVGRVESGSQANVAVPVGALRIVWREATHEFEESHEVRLAPGEHGRLTWTGEP